MSARCCPMCVSSYCPFPVSAAGGHLLWVVRAVYPLYLWGFVCVSSPFSCVRVLAFHLGGEYVLLHWRRLWRFGEPPHPVSLNNSKHHRC